MCLWSLALKARKAANWPRTFYTGLTRFVCFHFKVLSLMKLANSDGSFLSKVTFHMVNVKRVVLLIAILVVILLYLTSPNFNSSSKSNRLFLLKRRKYIVYLIKKSDILH